MKKQEEKVRKALDLFERYIMAIVQATGSSLEEPKKELKAVREEVITLINNGEIV